MNVLVIARNTYREATRDRVLAGVLGAGLAVIALSHLLGPLALGEKRRLAVDLGLAAISALGILVIVLVGTSLVAKELDRKTVYNLLSRPVSRTTYLVGKWSGLAAALWVVCIGLGLALWLTLVVRGFHGHGLGILGAVYLTGLELTVVTALAVLFSTLSTPVLSALYTLAFYVVGQWSYDLRAFAAKFPPEVGGMVETLANLVPNLPLFNGRTVAAVGEVPTPVHVAIATAYALVYCACALALATAAFERRDLK